MVLISVVRYESREQQLPGFSIDLSKYETNIGMRLLVHILSGSSPPKQERREA